MAEMNLWTATDKEQATEKYGLNYVKSVIYSEWFNESPKKSYYHQRESEFAEIRSHMDGNVDISKFKDMLGINTDKSTMAIDWSYLPTVPKYIKSVIDGYSEDIYFVNADAIDSFSQKEKRRKEHEIRAKMKLKDTIEEFSKQTGYDFGVTDNIPETDEEMYLQLEMDSKLKHEIAIENSVKKIFDINEWGETFNMVAEDLAALGVGAARHELDPEYGIKLRYVDPMKLIYSRDQYRDRNGKGRYYYGEMLALTIAEVERLANGKFSKKELLKFAGKHSNVLNLTVDSMSDVVVDVVRFCFKTTKKRVFKKKYNRHGGYKYVKKDSDWNPPEDRMSTKVSETYETWYSGYWIVGSELMWDYCEMKDLVRPKSNIRKAIPPYAVYDIKTQSLASKIRILADQIQLAHLKIQVALAKMKSAGYQIDIDMLQDIDLGNGSKITVAQQIAMFQEGGDIVYSGKQMDGSLNPRTPINLYPATELNEITHLMAVKEGYRNDIESLTGINAFRDGSTPDSRALVGVQKLAIMMSNNATKHIFRGAENIAVQMAQGIATRLQDLGIYGEVGKGLRQLIGDDNADVLEKDKNKFFWAFSLGITLKPTEEERQELKNQVAMALQAGLISLSDAIDIQNIDNIKLASKVLAAKEKAKMREKQKQEKEMLLIQESEKRNTAVTIEKAKAEAANAEMQAKSATLSLQSKLQAMLQSNDWLAKMKYMNAEYDRKERIAQIEAQTRTAIEGQKEDRKDDRVKKEGTIQSELADQRAKNLPPKDFTQEDINTLQDILG